MIKMNLKSDTRQSAWRRANPERYRAHVSVQRALSAGAIEKGPCEVCGSTIVDGHHDDYSQPLEIRWLCRKHHNQLHAQQRHETGMKRSMKRERNVSETLQKRREGQAETRPNSAQEQIMHKSPALAVDQSGEPGKRNVRSRNAASRVTSRDKRDSRETERHHQ